MSHNAHRDPQPHRDPQHAHRDPQHAHGDPQQLLARLVGPPGPELTCEQCFDELDHYVDLELAGADADAAIPGMRAHLEGCSACAEDRDSLRELLLRDARPDS